MTGPTLFLLGAPRSGSTQLARWIDSHPDCSLSAIKEPNFFAAHDFDPDYVAASHLDDIRTDAIPTHRRQFAVLRDRATYDRLFAGLTTRWRLDASTSYLACPQAPGAIRAAFPDARVIVLTRDPVDRAVSHYGLALRTGRTRARLGDELADELSGRYCPGAQYLLRPSRQAAGLARVRAAFPGRSILELRFSDMVRDPAGTMSVVGAFLDIDPALFDLSVQARNETALPRFARLNAWALSSGVKTRLRRALPDWAKPTLKRVWFNAAVLPEISVDERAALASLLSDEYEKAGRP